MRKLLNGFKHIWSEEFNGDRIDADIWRFDYGWGNNEWQNYTAGRNADVTNGT
jgi:hypothetical protein